MTTSEHYLVTIARLVQDALKVRTGLFKITDRTHRRMTERRYARMLTEIHTVVSAALKAKVPAERIQDHTWQLGV